jgi:phospholipid/cholesterol/gamma-HCH transport system substrate-binding protein
LNAVPAPAERGRFSLEALQESRWARALFGIVLAGFVIGIAYVIVLAFTGTFSNVVKVNAELPAGSNAVPISAPVEYRNVTVGKVGAETPGPAGTTTVQFEIYPRNLPRIPKGVEAQVSPLSIFGNQYVDLVPPATIASGHLAAGDFVPAYTGAASTSLQGTVAQLYGLLNAIKPADLDTALTALATALNGEGTALGQTLTGSSDYLGQAVVPNLTTIGSDLRLLPPVSNALVKATPDVLGTLANSSVTAQTLTSQQQALHTLLSAGTQTVGQFASELQQVETTLPSLLNESGPLLSDITSNPHELSQTLSGLTQFATAVAAAESHGPYLSVTAKLPVANISAGVNAALGYDNPASVDSALGSQVNPPTYTASDCPRYPGESNPYCGTGGSPDAQPAGGTVSAASQRSAPAGPPTVAEASAVSLVAEGLFDGQQPPLPGFADLVIYPLLASMTGG